jgi:hypothetical protein
MSIHHIARGGRRFGVNDYPVTSTFIPMPIPVASFPYTGLKSYFRMDGNSSGSTDIQVRYASGGNFGKINQGVQFYTPDGYGSSQISIASASRFSGTDYDNAWTITFWFNLVNMNAKDNYLFSWGNEKNAQFYVRRTADSGDLLFATYNGGSTTNGTTSSFTANNWYHVGISRASNVVKMYVNGAPDPKKYTGTGDATAALNVPQSFGCGIDGYSNMSGSIDEIGFWTRVLTDAEISTLYNNGTGLSPT